MAFGIYKPGQGYWVRVMTAAGLGVLTLASAAWIAQEAEIVAERLPKASYELSLRAVRGEVAPGDTVALRGLDADSGEQVQIGEATVREFDADNRRVLIDTIRITGDEGNAEDVERVTSAGGFGAVVERRRGDPVVQPVLVQGVSAAVVLLLGALLTYYFVGVKKPSSEFLINTDMEMKKVNWSSRKEIQGSTMVVIVAAFLIAAILFVFDFVLQTFFRAIGVLV